MDRLASARRALNKYLSVPAPSWSRAALTGVVRPAEKALRVHASRLFDGEQLVEIGDGENVSDHRLGVGQAHGLAFATRMFAQL